MTKIPYEDILDDDERILWSKEFPPRDVRPNKKKKMLGGRISIMIFVVILIIAIFAISIFGNQYGSGVEVILFIFIISLIIIFVILLQIWDMRSKWKRAFELYLGYLDFYTERELENFPTYHLITDKNLLSNYGNEEYWFCFQNPIFYVEDVIKYEKDFLKMNLKHLFKIRIQGGSSKHGKFGIKFFFDKRNPEEMLKIIKDGDLKNLKRSYSLDIEECQYFFGLKKQELDDITKILLELNPNLKIE